MTLEHVVRRGVPKPQVLGPAGGEKAVVVGVEDYPSGRQAGALSGLFNLLLMLFSVVGW